MRMGSSCPWAFWEPTQPWLLWWTEARENSLILGHLWNILSIVFKARELSRKSFLSVFICNLMLSCSRACLWDLVPVLCTLICVKAFSSFLTSNFSEMFSLGTSNCSRQSSKGSHTLSYVAPLWENSLTFRGKKVILEMAVFLCFRSLILNFHIPGSIPPSQGTKQCC